MYSKEINKWKAYQFSDPFATSSFVCCHRASKTFCRPDCEHGSKTDLKSEVQFMDTAGDAISSGYMPCKYCDPVGGSAIDVDLLARCVGTVNRNIGFLNPLVDEDDGVNDTKIKANILESKLTNKEQVRTVIETGERRKSLPNIALDKSSIQSVNLTKNDSDHYRLVDLACRHLAYAAAVNLFFPKQVAEEDSCKKKRRRGGVLGFKELAAKSKLSAWHFHRVFKSVTGLTPKTYGDKCSEFLEKNKKYNSITQITPPVSEENSPIMFEPMQKKHRALAPLDLSFLSPTLQSPLQPVQQVPQTFIPDNYEFMFDFDNTNSNSLPDLREFSQPMGMEYDNYDLTPTSITLVTPQDNDPINVSEIQVPSFFNYDYELPDDLLTINF